MSRSLFVAAALPLLLTACGGGGGGTTNPPPAKNLGSITVTPTTMNLTAGNTSLITAQGLDDSNAALSGVTFGFVSNNTTVADVSSSGNVIGLVAGSATITVTGTLSGVSKTQTVAVTVSGALPLAASVSGGATVFTFSPQIVAIGRTGTVTWSFGATAHNVTFEPANGVPNGIGTGENLTASRTFNTAGNFSYQCSLHAGMGGTVYVR